MANTTYTLTSPDKPHVNRVGQSSELITDEAGYVIKCNPRIQFLIGWKIDRVRAWVRYKKWEIRSRDK